MTNAKKELRDAVDAAVQNLKTIADRHPATPMRADVFNMLLGQAKETFPGSKIIMGLQAIEEGTNATDVVFRLSALQGAIRADLRVEAAAAMGQIRPRYARSSLMDR